MRPPRICDLCGHDATRSYEFQRVDGDGDYFFWEIDFCDLCLRDVARTMKGYKPRESDWVR